MRWLLVIAFLMFISPAYNRNKYQDSVPSNIIRSKVDSLILSPDCKYNYEYNEYYDSLFVVENVRFSNVFKSDSGYLVKRDVIEITKALLPLFLCDAYYQASLEETPDDAYLGKYYKDEDPNIFIFCIPYFYGANFIFEFNTELNIIKYRNFASGNYNCCWGSDFDGFKKWGKYYSMRTCGTGSGYCSGYVSFFRRLENIPGNSIMEMCYCFDPRIQGFQSLSSIVKNITDTSLLFCYRYEEIDGESDEVLLTNYIDVEYILVDKEWISKDNIDFNEMYGLY